MVDAYNANLNLFIGGGANTSQAVGGQRLVVPGPTRIVRFTLTEDLTAGGSAAATLLYVNSSGTESTGPAIDVYDALGDTSASDGSRGYAVFMGDSGHYEVLVMTCV